MSNIEAVRSTATRPVTPINKRFLGGFHQPSRACSLQKHVIIYFFSQMCKSNSLAFGTSRSLSKLAFLVEATFRQSHVALRMAFTGLARLYKKPQVFGGLDLQIERLILCLF